MAQFSINCCLKNLILSEQRTLFYYLFLIFLFTLHPHYSPHPSSLPSPTLTNPSSDKGSSPWVTTLSWALVSAGLGTSSPTEAGPHCQQQLILSTAATLKQHYNPGISIIPICRNRTKALKIYVAFPKAPKFHSGDYLLGSGLNTWLTALHDKELEHIPARAVPCTPRLSSFYGTMF